MNRFDAPNVLALLCVTVALGACTVHGRTRAYVEPVGTVEVTAAPVVAYWRYPSTVYQGRTVYLIEDRWGYPSGDHWVYFRTEPPPLARYRTTIEQAPPAPRGNEPPPPPRRSAPPPTSAPPATRTR